MSRNLLTGVLLQGLANSHTTACYIAAACLRIAVSVLIRTFPDSITIVLYSGIQGIITPPFSQLKFASNATSSVLILVVPWLLYPMCFYVILSTLRTYQVLFFSRPRFCFLQLVFLFSLHLICKDT